MEYLREANVECNERMTMPELREMYTAHFGRLRGRGHGLSRLNVEELKEKWIELKLSFPHNSKLSKDHLYQTAKYMMEGEDHSTVTFGQYKGVAFLDVPQDYLNWVMMEHDKPKECSPEFVRFAVWAKSRRDAEYRGYGQNYADPEEEADVRPPPRVAPKTSPAKPKKVLEPKTVETTTRKNKTRALEPPEDFAMVSSTEEVLTTGEQIQDLEQRLAMLRDIKQLEENRHQGGARGSGSSEPQ